MTPLMVVTDRTQLPRGRTLVETVAACVAAGAGTVLLREIDLPYAERVALAWAIGSDEVELLSARVLLPGATGVHLAAHQAATAERHGRSCHSAVEVRRAAGAGASWVTLSPFAVTASKPGHGPPLGQAAFAGPHPIPVYALGGVTVDNAAAAVVAGATGVAVMGEVMRATDPAAVVAELLEALR